MTAYISRRLLLSIPTILIVAFLSFMLMRLQPGNVVLAQLSSGGAAGGDAQVDRAQLEELKKELGLEGSIPEQFVRWAGGVLQGDFGRSWLTERSTLDQFIERAPLTIQLGIVAVGLSLLIGVPIGVISAARNDTAIDYVGRTVAIAGLAVPNFFLGTLVVIFLSREFGWTSGAPTVEPPWEGLGEYFKRIFFPAFTLAFASAGLTVRLVRASLLEVLRQDYIRTARAKGLKESVVLVKHALRNALVPVVTLIGAQLTFIIAGSIVVEQLFNLRGLGLLTLTAIQQRDYVQLQTNITILSFVIILGNLITDISYGYLDPRIRQSYG